MTLSRRTLLAALSTAPLCSPSIGRAQTKDLVVGGAAGMAGYMKEFVFPVIEKKHGMRIVFDGTRSLVNLEKMRADKAAPKMSVVLMDDPIMQLAFEEGLLSILTTAPRRTSARSSRRRSMPTAPGPITSSPGSGWQPTLRLRRKVCRATPRCGSPA